MVRTAALELRAWMERMAAHSGDSAILKCVLDGLASGDLFYALDEAHGINSANLRATVLRLIERSI